MTSFYCLELRTFAFNFFSPAFDQSILVLRFCFLTVGPEHPVRVQRRPHGPHHGQRVQRPQLLHRSVRLRERQLPLLQPHAQHREDRPDGAPVEETQEEQRLVMEAAEPEPESRTVRVGFITSACMSV